MRRVGGVHSAAVLASRARRSVLLGGGALALLARMAAPTYATECRPFVEEDRAGTYATFRANTDAFGDCPVSEETYRSVVATWLRERPADAAPVETLSLGRAVAFPWLSRLIADTAVARPGWAQRLSTAGGPALERLGAEVLRDQGLLARLAAPFRGSRYAVARLSFEKVLFGAASDVSSSPQAGTTPVPFDAQLWLRLDRQ